MIYLLIYNMFSSFNPSLLYRGLYVCEEKGVEERLKSTDNTDTDGHRSLNVLDSCFVQTQRKTTDHTWVSPEAPVRCVLLPQDSSRPPLPSEDEARPPLCPKKTKEKTDLRLRSLFNKLLKHIQAENVLRKVL